MTYVVVENTPGYLPDDTDPATFETFAAAEQYAAELADEAASVDGGTAARESETLWRVTVDRPHALDRVVEILETEPGDV